MTADRMGCGAYGAPGTEAGMTFSKLPVAVAERISRSRRRSERNEKSDDARWASVWNSFSFWVMTCWAAAMRARSFSTR